MAFQITELRIEIVKIPFSQHHSPMRIAAACLAAAAVGLTPVAAAGPAFASNVPGESQPNPRRDEGQSQDGQKYYSCTAYRAKGPGGPLMRGDDGYTPGLDADHDGRACEANEDD